MDGDAALFEVMRAAQGLSVRLSEIGPGVTVGELESGIQAALAWIEAASDLAFLVGTGLVRFSTDA